MPGKRGAHQPGVLLWISQHSLKYLLEIEGNLLIHDLFQGWRLLVVALAACRVIDDHGYTIAELVLQRGAAIDIDILADPNGYDTCELARI